MEDYLSGYLEVLPEFQRRQIEEIIKDNQELYHIASTTEEQFVEIIRRLAERNEALTQVIKQEEKLDAGKHNEMFARVDVDLNFLFLESLLIESSTTNYERIFDGIIADLDNEVKKLRQRVESLRLVSEGEDGLVVEKRTFDSSSEMETYENNPTLFCDRDGTAIQRTVSFERVHDQRYICLSKTKDIDCVRNENGIATARIEVSDRRGMPSGVSNAPRYSLENAIDGNTETYWAEVVLTDEPLNIKMYKG